MLGPDHEQAAAHHLEQVSESKLHSAQNEKALSAQSHKEHLTQIARLVADGQIELPHGLSDDQFRIVVDLVRERWRQNLVRHIARCIAADLIRGSDPKEGFCND